jgi:Txe/YoeB family toxin of Txe-Axe toxin-antitoxin module
MAAVQGIRTAINLATEKTIQASNNLFGFVEGATVDNLTDLANDIQLAVDNGMSPAQIDDIITSSNLIFDVEEARNSSQGLLNPSVTADQRINAIKNYVNLIKKFRANPNYFQHMRSGDMGMAVVSPTKKGGSNIVYLQTARSQDYRKALTIGKRAAKGTRIRSPISITPLEASRRMMAELAPELQSRIDDGEFGEGARLKIIDFNKDRLSNHSITLTDLAKTENIFNVLMSNLATDPFEGIGRSKEAKQAAIEENKKFLEELVGTAKQNMLNNMYGGGLENAP